MKPALPQPLANFLRAVPSDKACHKYHFERWVRSGQSQCDRCRSKNLIYKTGRTAKCTDCKKSVHFYGGTLYERVRRVRSLTALVIAAECGYIFNSLSASRYLGVSQSCAWEQLQRVRMVLDEQMPAVIRIESAKFSGAICKRSRNTPARSHPLVELARRSRHKGQRTDAADQARILKIVAFQREHFHGVSMRYLQLYVAQFWSLLHPAWLQGEALQKACWTRGDISGKQLHSYDCGDLVMLPAA